MTHLQNLRRALLLGTVLALGTGLGIARDKKPKPTETGLQNFIRQARATQPVTNESHGSLWVDHNGLADGYRDVRAFRVNDIVTIQVLETTSAVSEATTETLRESELSGGFTNLFGLEKGVKELPTLVGGGGSAKFTGDGSTTRRTVLTTNVAARVVEVFPAGQLLLEGSREIAINNERQTVVVRGIVRPEDVTTANTVLSSNVAEMEVSVEGKGTVSAAQKPGIVTRILQAVWPF